LLSASASFFFVFSVFVDLGPRRSAWRKKSPEKCPRALIYTRAAGSASTDRLACLSGLPSQALAVGHSAQNVTNCLN
jgi:hypothetical protein